MKGGKKRQRKDSDAVETEDQSTKADDNAITIPNKTKQKKKKSISEASPPVESSRAGEEPTKKKKKKKKVLEAVAQASVPSTSEEAKKQKKTKKKVCRLTIRDKIREEKKRKEKKRKEKKRKDKTRQDTTTHNTTQRNTRQQAKTKQEKDFCTHHLKSVNLFDVQEKDRHCNVMKGHGIYMDKPWSGHIIVCIMHGAQSALFSPQSELDLCESHFCPALKDNIHSIPVLIE